MNNCIKNEKGFLGLLGLLLAIVIIFLLSYKVLKVYFKKPLPQRDVENSLVGQYPTDIPEPENQTYTGVLNSTRNKIQDINAQLKERYKQ